MRLRRKLHCRRGSEVLSEVTFASQRPTARLVVLHADEHLLVVAKPPGMAVHRSRLVHDESVYLVDLLRDQLAADGAGNSSLHPIHRLDRGTSGALLVGRNPAIAAALSAQFMSRDVEKTYLAVCRGWPDDAGEIDYPLPGVNENGERKPALTRWTRLATVEVPIAISRYPQQRYALLAVSPETGRYRQIRRHLSHVHHHLIGDTSHGRGDHNRLFRQHFGIHRMLLHAWRLRFEHPISGETLLIEAPLDAPWNSVLDRFGWHEALANHRAIAG